MTMPIQTYEQISHMDIREIPYNVIQCAYDFLKHVKEAYPNGANLEEIEKDLHLSKIIVNKHKAYLNNIKNSNER